MIWKLWYFLFFIHFALTANNSQWVAPYFSQRYRVIEWEKLASTEKNSHLKFQAMCMPCNIHNHLWEVFFRFNSSCTTTWPPLYSNLPDRRSFFGRRGWGKSISLVWISNYCHFVYWAVGHVLCCLWPFHLSLCCFFKAMMLVGSLPQQGLINRLLSHQHVQI